MDRDRRSSPRPTSVATSAGPAARPGTNALDRDVRTSEAASVADALLDCVTERLGDVARAADAEDRPSAEGAWRHRAAHAAYGRARLPSAERWHPIARAYHLAAQAAARGDLVGAVSRLRHAERLDADARAAAAWVMPPLAADAPWRDRVPSVFAPARAVPPAVDVLLDRILDRRGGGRREGVADVPEAATTRLHTEADDDDVDR